MAAEVRLSVHVLGTEVRTGGWCEECALPSLIEADVTIAVAGGVQTGTVKRCTNHEGTIDDEA